MTNASAAIINLVSERLAYFKDKNINRQLMLEVYQVIFNTLVDVFSSAKIQISNEAMNLIAQLLYDMTSINEVQELDPNIFSEQASVKNVSTKELAFLATLFRDTPELAGIFAFEIKRRS